MKKIKKETSSSLKPETKNGITAVIFFVLAVFSVLSVVNLSGQVGRYFFENILKPLFGFGYLLMPIIFVFFGVLSLRNEAPKLKKKQWLGALMLLIAALGILETLFGNQAGGIVGLLAQPLIQWFDKIAAFAFLLALAIISILILFETRLNIPKPLLKIWPKLLEFRPFRRKDNSGEPEIYGGYGEEKKKNQTEESKKEILEKETGTEKEKEFEELEEETDLRPANYKFQTAEYVPPPLALLEKDRGKPNVGDIKANSNIIKRTLKNFGIEVEMDEITIGPTITRYSLKPAEGVKLSRILALQNDLALALAAHPIRIEAPIPGKSLVGVEVPNQTKSIVGLATMLADEKFSKSGKPLIIAIGRSVSGAPFFGDLSKMPHLLIAGATGSGKSIMIHSTITSLLYRNRPEDLRFILIDPKRVELPIYNKIPHLLAPVITDYKKAIMSLKWATREMERRYGLLEKERTRDLESYNAKTRDKAEKMPYIVVIIDELADIMSTYPRELEAAVVRLSQMSRSVGIHLILSTQRPSVNIITGLIKANIPARLALQVSSQIDSRTILDTGGAEKLLGAGDLLFLSGEMSQPKRLQSAFVSEEEVKKVVKFLAKNYGREEIDSELEAHMQMGANVPDLNDFDRDNEGDDELYAEAKEWVCRAGKASTSYLQRKMKVGYSRAARLIDMLEERGVVGPADGAKPREVLIRPDDNAGN